MNESQSRYRAVYTFVRCNLREHWTFSAPGTVGRSSSVATVCRRVSDWIEDLASVDGQRDIWAEYWKPLLTFDGEKLASFVPRKARWTSPCHRIELDFSIAIPFETKDFRLDGPAILSLPRTAMVFGPSSLHDEPITQSFHVHWTPN